MSEKKKNVIWIFGDQHRGQALSCSGDPNLSTPCLDRLANEGVHFPNAVAGAPLCCPFRGSLISGLYSHNCVPGHEYPLDPKLPTIANVFSENGYETAYFGKWHLDGWHERDGRAALHFVPKERRGGFDTWLGYDNNNCQWDSWVHGHRQDEGEIEHYRLPGFETDCLTDMLIEFILEKGEEKDGKNFFASLSVQPPHDPYLAPPEFMERHNPMQLEMRPNVPDIPRVQKQARRELAGAYAQIENLDWNVGRIRDALAEAGLEFDTYIVFFSDHGDMHGSQGHFRKTSPYEESIKIPFIIGGPPTKYGHKAGKPDAVVNCVDIAPTTLGLCGIDKPDWMAGTDYSGYYLAGRELDAPDSAYIGIAAPTGHGDSIDRAWRGVVTRDGWKYVALEGQPWLLFDLNEDPYEQANLAHNSRFGRKRQELNDRLKKWVEDTGDEFVVPEL